MTVVAGYIRMLLKERAGPLSEDQRKLLQEAEKSCGRLSGLVAEMSDLANLEAGTIPVARTPVDVRALLTEVINLLPAMPDREIRVELRDHAGPVTVMGDATRLRAALSAIVSCMRRELVTSDALFVKYSTLATDATCAIAIGDAEGLDKLDGATGTDLGLFDEWRGGCGLSLAIARRTVSAHGGGIWSPADGSKLAAVVHLPLQR